MTSKTPNRLPAISVASLAFGILSATPLAATTISVGQIIDDPGYNFDSFGSNADESTRGANFGGTFETTWNNVSLLTDRTGASNGISWTGTDVSAVGDPGAGEYLYSAIYFGDPGTGADADEITNTGIHSAPTISISATVGKTYTIDLLFAQAFTPRRTFDVLVEGSIYLDDLALDLNEGRPLVYRFETLATDDTINITFAPGSEPGYDDTNPYVNAVMVTEVIPEPSAAVMALIGAAGLAARRRR